MTVLALMVNARIVGDETQGYQNPFPCLELRSCCSKLSCDTACLHSMSYNETSQPVAELGQSPDGLGMKEMNYIRLY